MTYFVVVLSSLGLLIGFGVLVTYEKKQGVRFFAEKRARFDKHIERIEFILEHVDFAAFLKEEVGHVTNRVSHFFAHISLQFVRSTERLLTRLVRHLRRQNEDASAPRESTREFVKTLADFKDNLKDSHVDGSVSKVDEEITDAR